MVSKPLYHGGIHVHGSAPSPDQTIIATTGRGSSNVYLIDARKMTVIGNRPNLRGTEATNTHVLTSGILVGREPHEPTFSRNGKEIWVTLRGEDRIAILETETAKKVSAGESGNAIRMFQPTVYGPAQVWFSKDGALAFVVSQKMSEIDVLRTNVDGEGFSHPPRVRTINIKEQDPYGFTPFQKIVTGAKHHRKALAPLSQSKPGSSEVL
jgi:DNA-binding beta-propeller fold protein YncE